MHTTWAIKSQGWAGWNTYFWEVRPKLVIAGSLVGSDTQCSIGWRGPEGPREQRQKPEGDCSSRPANSSQVLESACLGLVSWGHVWELCSLRLVPKLLLVSLTETTTVTVQLFTPQGACNGRAQSRLHPNVPQWHTDYFESKLFKKWPRGTLGP